MVVVPGKKERRNLGEGGSKATLLKGMEHVFWHMIRRSLPAATEYAQVRSFGYHVLHAWEVMRTRRDALLYVCLRGEPRFCHNRHWFTGARGSVDLYLPGEAQHYSCAGGWEAFWFHFDPSPSLLEILRRHGIAGGTLWPKALKEQALVSLERMFVYARLPEHLAYHRAAVDLERIIFDCLGENTDGVIKPQRIRLRDIGDYVRMNPGGEHRVATLARRAGLSPSRFAHLFKEEYGMPVGAYVTRVRMESAAHLLHTTRMTAAEIGSHLGYRSPFHFYTTFRKVMGQTPTTYRRKQLARGSCRTPRAARLRRSPRGVL